MSFNLELLPKELREKGLFCTWRLTDKGKTPFNPINNTLAKTNDKSTFHNLEKIRIHIPKYLSFNDSNEMVGGIGLGLFNGFSAIDIDDCRNPLTGELSAMAKDIINDCQSYTEISPSKTGIRIIFRTTTTFDKNQYYTMNSKLGLEVYIEGQTNKYVTITTNIIYPNDIKDIDLTYILNTYMSKNNNYTLEDAIRKDAKLNELWNNQAPGSGSNESELDLALCSKLAHYLKNDIEAIEEAFTSSPYYRSKDKEHKDKWNNREDYRKSTINKALKENIRQQEMMEDFNDTENAKLLIREYGNVIKYNEDNKTWMMYDGYRWIDRQDLAIRDLCDDIVEKLKLDLKNELDVENQKKLNARIKNISNTKGKDNMIKEARSFVRVVNNDFDKEKHLINTKSGIVNLKNGEIYQHDSKYMMTNFINLQLNQDAPTLFLKFLFKILGNNVELVEYINQLLGYSLTGETKEQSMYMLVGDGSNGKSLLLRVLNDIFSTYSKPGSIDMIMEVKNKSDRSEQEFASIKGKRVVFLEEGDMNAKLNEGKVKKITGQTEITARFLYGNDFTFTPQFKIIVASNYKPYIMGSDYGIWRRIKIIPFNVIIPTHEQDLDLKEKLEKEYESILNWIVMGAINWYKNGRLKEVDAITNAVEEYKKTMDVIDMWIDDNCVVDKSYETRATLLFKDFNDWAKLNNRNAFNNTNFGLKLGKKFVFRIKDGYKIYQGIKLKGIERKYENV